MEIHRERIGCLIREEVSRKWFSYAKTAVVVVFLGLVIVPYFISVVIPPPPDVEPLDSGSARRLGFFLDLYLLVIISILSIDTIIYRDPVHGWLLFLRSLPVSPKEVVLARSLVMLPATVVMTALLFAPLFIQTQAPVLELPVVRFPLPVAKLLQFSAGQYLWFGLFWLGYALFAAGINLYMELGIGGKVVFGLQFVWLLLLVAISWLAGGNLVLTTFELSGDHGPLLAGLALLAGGVLFAVFAKAAEHRAGRREFAV